jgi:hypothetical protein
VKALEAHKPQLLIDDRAHQELIKYEETTHDMADWMVVTLSASLGGHVVKEGRPSRHSTLPTRGHVSVPLPVKRPIRLEASSEYSYIFNAEDVDRDMINRLGLQYSVQVPNQVRDNKSAMTCLAR